MNTEVNKCASKREELHNTFGDEMFSSWRKEHSGEVLTQHEQVAVGGTLLF